MHSFTLASPLLISLLQAISFVDSTAVPESVDVAVVGAGLAGLTAARDLLQASKSVVVLEARDRVGGKVYNQPLANGGVTEVGAEFVGPTQDKVLDMISDLGLSTFATNDEGVSILWRNGTRNLFIPDPQLGGAPPVDESALLQIAVAQSQLDTWAAELNTSAPWTHPHAEIWDNQTFDNFLEGYASHSDARFVLTTACKAIFSAEPPELSLLYVLAYIAAAGNETTTGSLSRLIAVNGGAQELRVVGGTGLIPERLADVVGYNHITLNAPVVKVLKCDAGYEVFSKAGTVVAKSVVLALSPPLLRKITFEPPLPSDRQALNDRTKMGALGKGIPVYETPFWRSEGNISAQVTSDTGSVRVTFDSSPDDASFGAILGFILGDEMRAIDELPAQEAKTNILSDYVRYYGEKAANNSDFILFRWDLEEWSEGGPTAISPPNVLTKYGNALRQSIDGLHFAGTETSEHWTGYMDGAIRSGERVAQEIQGLA
ncbi:amine oxidase [Stagonosporopsis vannaccii]|nr:amine oxidase [Stagonosporopsis vannaccii]